MQNTWRIQRKNKMNKKKKKITFLCSSLKKKKQKKLYTNDEFGIRRETTKKELSVLASQF